MKSDPAAPPPGYKAWQLRILLSLVLTTITLLFPLTPALADTPSLSLQFYGTVSENGTAVGAGYSVVAKISGVQKSSATTDSQGRYGYSPMFLVSCAGGQIIKFFINGKEAAENITCSAAPARLLNLHVTGAAPATQTIVTTILGKSENIILSNGRLALGKELSSADGRVRLKLDANTTINLQGATTLFAASETNPPAAADNSTAVRAYVFTPAGATFSPAATLKLKYETAWLPAGVSESSLYMSYWTGSAWSRLSSSCNTTANLVSAPVSHFTTFAIRAPKAPPQPTTRVVNTNILGKSENITLAGNVLRAARSLSSADGRISIALADNTTVNLQGSQQITVIQLASPPAAPAGVKLIEAYSFDPDGASFSPGATLSIKYTPANLPAGVKETGLYLALLSNSIWTEIPSTVNAQANTVAARLDHFSIYALLGKVTATPPPPAKPAFVASDLTVSPQVAVQGEQVTVSVRVANNGTASDNQTIILKLNDKNEAQKALALEPGKSQVVTFSLSKSEPGTYRVAISNLTASFEVKAGTAPALVAGLSWPVLIIIVIGGLLLLVFIISLLFKQR